MSALRIYRDIDMTNLLFSSHNPDSINQQLDALGVGFTQWPLDDAINHQSCQQQIIRAYQANIDSLSNEHGYDVVEVIDMTAEHPDANIRRADLIREHIKTTGEVYFFAGGEGLLSLHIEHKVIEVLCQSGDVIQVPARTQQWFDIGNNPTCTIIRLAKKTDNDLPQYTGSNIAERYNRLEN